jgi:hypothetical protein
MTKFLLSVHVLAAILTIGPIAVAASLFPRYARSGDSPGVTALLHRICQGYAVVGVAVPVFGVATGAKLGVLTDAWLLVSMALTAVAASLLILAILPHQQRLLTATESSTAESSTAESSTAETSDGATAGRLAALTGVFNLLWAIVVVLMIVRPGSTTGA